MYIDRLFMVEFWISISSEMMSRQKIISRDESIIKNCMVFYNKLFQLYKPGYQQNPTLSGTRLNLDLVHESRIFSISSM